MFTNESTSKIVGVLVQIIASRMSLKFGDRFDFLFWRGVCYYSMTRRSKSSHEATVHCFLSCALQKPCSNDVSRPICPTQERNKWHMQGEKQTSA